MTESPRSNNFFIAGQKEGYITVSRRVFRYLENRINTSTCSHFFLIGFDNLYSIYHANSKDFLQKGP